ncbi:helix-turn-helix transcriptional regulator [Castellaniella defragrans]|uniref:AraC-like DNA-binding protein n=2 Tax=Castellaniella defragrans TaxID=75697 RepID=A0A7W9WNB2_CASDE|nr:AraC family transcriptional regulator [Castellaniella defragrans]MBB6082610.1 AraC-like DNA-binding protein [Castellaniella defragrans]
MDSPAPVHDPGSVLDTYGRDLDARPSRFAPAPLPPADPARGGPRAHGYRIPPPAGSGWTDMHEFGNGLLITRLRCRFRQAFEEEQTRFPDNVRLGLLLEGTGALAHAGGESSVGAGSVVARLADPGPVRNRIPGGQAQAGVALDMPRAMLDTLQAQGLAPPWLGREGALFVFRPDPRTGAELCRLGRRLLGLRPGGSLLAALALESLSLDMLLRLLSAHPSSPARGLAPASRRDRDTLDAALDILHAEWDQPLTIAALARRAGTNECYLKMRFRQHTGQTIAAYLRSLRMRHARDLLESRRYTVQETAQLCGYLHAGKFSQAFRREFGCPPSSVR